MKTRQTYKSASDLVSCTASMNSRASATNRSGAIRRKGGTSVPEKSCLANWLRSWSRCGEILTRIPSRFSCSGMSVY